MTLRRGAALTTAATLGRRRHRRPRTDRGQRLSHALARRPGHVAGPRDQPMCGSRSTGRGCSRSRDCSTTTGPNDSSRSCVAADAIGVRPWACLHEAAVPRWFDNDGGFGDDETFTTWWPRWVERVASASEISSEGGCPSPAFPPGRRISRGSTRGEFSPAGRRSSPRSTCATGRARSERTPAGRTCSAPSSGATGTGTTRSVRPSSHAAPTDGAARSARLPRPSTPR